MRAPAIPTVAGTTGSVLREAGKVRRDRLLRTLEFSDKQKGAVFLNRNLMEQIGQTPFGQPSVFNFYNFDYLPAT